MTDQNLKITDARKSLHSKGAGMATFTVPAVLDMRAVRSLKSELDDLYLGKQSCELKLQDVEKVSTGCLQVLAAFVQSMHAAEIPVSLFQPSNIFKKGIEDLGLVDVFSLQAKEA
ncbi:MAG: STAS domain-containing protein [Hyphomicrobiaceae bacterium]